MIADSVDAVGSSGESGCVVAEVLDRDKKVADGGRRVRRGLRESKIFLAAAKWSPNVFDLVDPRKRGVKK